MDYRRPALVTANDVKVLQAPFYAIVADNNIFFPGDKTLGRCRAVFTNFKEAHVLKNSKHIPEADRYPEIRQQIENQQTD